MSTRVTLLQVLKLALTALIIGLLPNPLYAGDKTYIEVEIDGETVGKWVEFKSLEEYNPDGKEVYWKMAFDGTITETWYEYDRNGKRIHTKYSDGSKRWYEYDTYGNMTRKIWKSEDGKIDITVYILEYYRDSATVKTKTAYYYEQ